jgi:hypothetical protein
VCAVEGDGLMSCKSVTTLKINFLGHQSSFAFCNNRLFFNSRVPLDVSGTAHCDQETAELLLQNTTKSCNIVLVLCSISVVATTLKLLKRS